MAKLTAAETANNSASFSMLLPLLLLGIPITGSEAFLYNIVVNNGHEIDWNTIVAGSVTSEEYLLEDYGNYTESTSLSGGRTQVDTYDNKALFTNETVEERQTSRGLMRIVELADRQSMSIKALIYNEYVYKYIYVCIDG